MAEIQCNSREEFDSLIKRFTINSDCNEANFNLVSFLTLVTNSINVFIDNDHELSKNALLLLESNLFNKNQRFCISKLLSIYLIIEVNFELKKFISIILYLVLKLNLINLNFLRFEFNILKIILNFIDMNLNDFDLIKINTDILFEFIKKIDLLESQEFSLITDTLIEKILNSINFHYNNENDDEKSFTYCKLKIMLILNEQFLMKFHNMKKAENKIFDKLSKNDLNLTSDLIIFYFNRENDNLMKILILKFLYLIFTNSTTSSDFFYLNDLKILVDIFIRELNNLSVENNENLIIIYLKVFFPLLSFSQLKNENYKRNEIVTSLLSLSNNYNPESVVNSSKKCLAIPWLKCGNQYYLQNNYSSSDSLTTMKISTPHLLLDKKLPPPPPPPPRRVRKT